MSPCFSRLQTPAEKLWRGSAWLDVSWSRFDGAERVHTAAVPEPWARMRRSLPCRFSLTGADMGCGAWRSSEKRASQQRSIPLTNLTNRLACFPRSDEPEVQLHSPGPSQHLYGIPRVGIPIDPGTQGQAANLNLNLNPCPPRRSTDAAAPTRLVSPGLASELHFGTLARLGTVQSPLPCLALPRLASRHE